MSIYKNFFERIKETFYYLDKKELFSRISLMYATAVGTASIFEACLILNIVIENENNEFTDEDIEIAKEIKNRIEEITGKKKETHSEE